MNAIAGLGAPLVAALWAIAFATAVAWLGRQVQRGAPVTVTTYVVFFWFLLPILLQYPFTFSPLNAVFATGARAYEAYVRVVDRAFLASLLGMAAFCAGYALTPRTPRSFLPVRAVAYGLRGWTSTSLVWLSGAMVVLLFTPFALMGLTGSAGVRNLVLSIPFIRPLFNVIASLLPILIALVMLYATAAGRRSLWAMIAVLLLLAFETGSRAVAFGGILTFALTIGMHRSLRFAMRRRRVLQAVPLALVGLLLVFYLGDVREGRYNILLTVANFGALLFYGNNFSDLRDFAWVLAYWDGDLFLGRTQLAGVLGFIPSVLSDFRTHWGWGRVSTSIAGLGFLEADNAHAGLRPGMFGESFFNFGWVGVALAGLLLGWLCVRLEAAARAALAREPERGAFDTRLTLLAVFITLGLWSNVFISSGFFGVYVTLGALLLVRVTRLLLRAALAGAELPAAPRPAPGAG